MLLETLLPRLAIGVSPNGQLDAASARYVAGFARDLWLEIGFGAGEHLAFHAKARRDIAFIGCEPFVNGVARLLSTVASEDLRNVRIYPDDGRGLVAALPDRAVGRVFILFPDPWPKKSHHKRRLIQAAFVDQLARVMKDGAELRIATDHRAYCQWILARLLPHPDFSWTARKPADYRVRPPLPPVTRYERKAMASGRNCVYLIFRRRTRRAAAARTS